MAKISGWAWDSKNSKAWTHWKSERRLWLGLPKEQPLAAKSQGNSIKEWHQAKHNHTAKLLSTLG